MTKEVQMTAAFCGALAAVILISAPVSESIALGGSGVAFLISGGFFFGGIKNYFADKEKLNRHSAEQAAQQIQAVIDAVESLDDNLSRKLDDMSETLATLTDNSNIIKADTNDVANNAGKLKDLHKSLKSILDEIEDLSKVDETLRELTATMNRQTEFYRASLSQYKDMTTKDVELIETLARKLR